MTCVLALMCSVERFTDYLCFSADVFNPNPNPNPEGGGVTIWTREGPGTGGAVVPDLFRQDTVSAYLVRLITVQTAFFQITGSNPL